MSLMEHVDSADWFEKRSHDLEGRLRAIELTDPVHDSIVNELALCYRYLNAGQLQRQNDLIEAQVHIALAMSGLPFRGEFHKHVAIDEEGATDELHVSVGAILNRRIIHMDIIQDLLGMDIVPEQDEVDLDGPTN